MSGVSDIRALQSRADQLMDTLAEIAKSHNSITVQYLALRLQELERRMEEMEKAFLSTERRLDKAAEWVKTHIPKQEGNDGAIS
jgi:predicted transcriptional regulator